MQLFAHIDASASQALSIQAAPWSGLPGHHLPANPEAGVRCHPAAAHQRCSAMPGIVAHISILGYPMPEAVMQWQAASACLGWYVAHYIQGSVTHYKWHRPMSLWGASIQSSANWCFPQLWLMLPMTTTHRCWASILIPITWLPPMMCTDHHL